MILEIWMIAEYLYSQVTLWWNVKVFLTWHPMFHGAPCLTVHAISILQSVCSQTTSRLVYTIGSRTRIMLKTCPAKRLSAHRASRSRVEGQSVDGVDGR
ncbi:unnamed protein product [Dracunculus medinensis]|uniref:Secreted protein n=1 Tax=Dracunculus medinensis TaxID=318479 RepID=A0A0N4UIV1_DRAME|nr:unnamed protein product [Dracunculus medinensis]